MKRILIGVLLVILGMSYVVQKEHVLKQLRAPLTEQMRPVEATDIVKGNKPRQQQVEILSYPAPPDEPLPPYPAPSSPMRTPFPTPTLTLPTPAPTMNPWGD